MKNSILVSMLMLSTTAFAELPQAVTKAHEAFLRCDGSSIVKHIKLALEESQNHPLIVSNTMGLFSAAKKNGCLNEVKLDYSLPKDVSYLELEVARKYRSESGKVTFTLNGTVGVKKGATLEQFQVIRYPNQVMLDYKANIGEVDVEDEEQDLGYWIGGNHSVRPIDEGLYLVNIQVKDQPVVQGFVFLKDLNSSASPIILSPITDSSTEDSQPTFSWKPFKSPEASPDERTRIAVSVRHEMSEGDDLMWVQLKDTKATSFKVGDKEATKHYQGVTELGPQRYHMQVSYKEIEQFGEIGIRRASTTRVPFTIK